MPMNIVSRIYKNTTPQKNNIAPEKLAFQKLFSGATLLIFGCLSPCVSGQGLFASGSCFRIHTVDGRHQANHLGCKKALQTMGCSLPTSTGEFTVAINRVLFQETVPRNFNGPKNPRKTKSWAVSVFRNSYRSSTSWTSGCQRTVRSAGAVVVVLCGVFFDSECFPWF